MKRHVIDYCLLTLKGMAMGAADVVPGVSGGTIAFISGIYQELIETLSSFRWSLISEIKNHGLLHVWNKINGDFLVAVFGGILLSILSLSKLVSWLLKEEPIGLWSFFFGLVLASILFVLKKINRWYWITFLFLCAGALTAILLNTMDGFAGFDSNVYLFVCGAIAICAMILPGISGAFILVIMGNYQTILEAINTRNIPQILIFLSGALVGLLSFSKLLKWLFKNYYNPTLALLTGFMTGSLIKIWPWKTVISYRLNSEGIQVPLTEVCIAPMDYQGDPKILTSITLICIGFAMIFVLENLGSKRRKL